MYIYVTWCLHLSLLVSFRCIWWWRYHPRGGKRWPCEGHWDHPRGAATKGRGNACSNPWQTGENRCQRRRQKTQTRICKCFGLCAMQLFPFFYFGVIILGATWFYTWCNLPLLASGHHVESKELDRGWEETRSILRRLERQRGNDVCLCVRTVCLEVFVVIFPDKCITGLLYGSVERCNLVSV